MKGEPSSGGSPHPCVSSVNPVGVSAGSGVLTLIEVPEEGLSLLFVGDGEGWDQFLTHLSVRLPVTDPRTYGRSVVVEPLTFPKTQTSSTRRVGLLFDNRDPSL